MTIYIQIAIRINVASECGYTKTTNAFALTSAVDPAEMVILIHHHSILLPD